MIYYRKRYAPDLDANRLNSILTQVSNTPLRVTEVLYLDKTEDGNEYTVINDDGEERILLQHIDSRGITWMWMDDYDEFTSVNRYR